MTIAGCTPAATLHDGNMPRPTRLIVAVLTALFLAGCDISISFGPPSDEDVGTPAPLPSGVLPPTEARFVLESLTIAEAGPMDGYERSCAEGDACVFGPAWADVDRNGCDTRNDILRRDLIGDVAREGTHGCVIEYGILYDPYTGQMVEFERGPDSDEVQIDHVVALADAWRSGAASWPQEQRQWFANDPRNLRATIGEINQEKGDSGPAEWRPPNEEYWCEYAATYVTVKFEYRLTVTPEDADALADMLADCA